MPQSYGRDLDLNLLRVFVVVAETGSVTRAAAQLYLTQPAVSAALRRLTTAVGAPLFVRQGRGLALSARGHHLLAAARPALDALVTAALQPTEFDPSTSDRILRLGLSDTTEAWLLPALLRTLADEAPRMRLVILGVQFRTVEDALAQRRVDLAITVADELPPSIRRESLLAGDFVCIFDPRHAKLPRTVRERDYFAADHVIVSYNGDLRGIVEDVRRKTRRVRCSLPGFAHVGDALDGTTLVATVPRLVARQIRTLRPHLRIAELPFALRGGGSTELLWPVALDDDPACRYLRGRIVAIARATRTA